MSFWVCLVFIAGYIAIAFEKPLKTDKAALAIITGIICWILYFAYVQDKIAASGLLSGHFSNISSILFFILSAMTIVELIDSHNGFSVLPHIIKTKSKTKLLGIITFITFFLSSLLDNLTTAIIMTTLASKMLEEKEDRLWFTGMIIIAANAGGVFSPIGDVTTTMLWMGGQVTPFKILHSLFIPSLVVVLIPFIIVSLRFRGKYLNKMTIDKNYDEKEAWIFLLVGLSLLLLVPVFKYITGLPPFMCILFSLGIFWLFTSIVNSRKSEEDRKIHSVMNVMKRIDSPSILFFLGILLAVTALQSFGQLKQLAVFLDSSFGNFYLTGTALGIGSAVIDNVPLVAAAQGMYDLGTFGTDHKFWELIALSTGTGGSLLLIGSAAGIAAGGIENISFIWYLRKITPIALLGFVGGVLFYIFQNSF